MDRTTRLYGKFQRLQKAHQLIFLADKEKLDSEWLLEDVTTSALCEGLYYAAYLVASLIEDFAEWRRQ